MTGKARLSASVDAELLDVAHAAVKQGHAANVSAWVNDAMRLKVEHEHRLAALDTFLADYETEHGVITDTEIDQAVREARSRAKVIRSSGDRRSAPRRGVA